MLGDAGLVRSGPHMLAGREDAPQAAREIRQRSDEAGFLRSRWDPLARGGCRGSEATALPARGPVLRRRARAPTGAPTGALQALVVSRPDPREWKRQAPRARKQATTP